MLYSINSLKFLELTGENYLSIKDKIWMLDKSPRAIVEKPRDNYFIVLTQEQYDKLKSLITIKEEYFEKDFRFKPIMTKEEYDSLHEEQDKDLELETIPELPIISDREFERKWGARRIDNPRGE